MGLRCCHLLLEVQLKETCLAISNVLHKRNPLLRWCIKLQSDSLETQEDVFPVDEVVLDRTSHACLANLVLMLLTY